MQRYRTTISVDELRRGMAQPEWCIVDSRFELKAPEKGRQEYLSGHIPGAVYAHLDRDLADPVRADSGRHPLPDPGRLAALLGEWGISNTSQVVVYDHGSGAIAARLWWLLRWCGHTDVAVLNGGIGAWLRAGGRVEKDIPSRSAANFEAIPDDSMLLTTQELLSDRESILLIDARDRQRFLGHLEPIDPVAGHVPGARNLPFSECLGPDGHLLPAKSLRHKFDAILQDAAGRSWAAMCGSGVTACHLALSAEIAGIRPPRLYVGSWSEWIRDPARPVAAETAASPGPPPPR